MGNGAKVAQNYAQKLRCMAKIACSANKAQIVEKLRAARSQFSGGTKYFVCYVIIVIITSDRTDLSTESGSGPIQLARDRYRAARRSVADSPLHCMNAQKIVSYYTQSHSAV